MKIDLKMINTASKLNILNVFNEVDFIKNHE